MTTQLQLQNSGANFLDRVLSADGLFCTISGGVCLVGARPLATLFGLEAPFIFSAGGAVIMIYGLALLFLAGRTDHTRLLVQTAVFLNALWITISVAGLLAGWFPITTAGKWGVAIMADLVLLITAVQIYALRRDNTF